MKKVDLNNTMVEAKREDDGKIILDFFKDNDIRSLKNQSSPTGFRYSHDAYSNQKVYYGIINGELDFFKEYELQGFENVKILEMINGYIKLPVEEKVFPREMLVWDKKEANAVEGTIVGYLEGVNYPWLSISKRKRDRYFGYKNAKEIEVETISREDAEKKLNVKIKDN